MTREEVVQCPDYWKTLYEDECERLNIQPCLVFSKQEPINEEELDRLSTKALENINPTKALNKVEAFDWGYKDGYRKALSQYE